MDVCFLQVNVRRFAPRDPTVVQGQLLEAADAKNRDQARLSFCTVAFFLVFQRKIEVTIRELRPLANIL